MPCWGRAGATVCNDCALLQMPADYTGSFPLMEMQLPAVEFVPVIVAGEIVGTEEFCRERRSSGTHRPAALGGQDGQGVGGFGHIANVRPACSSAKPLDVGPAEGGQDTPKPALRNGGVTGRGA